MGRRRSKSSKRTRGKEGAAKAKPSRRQRFQARQRNTWLAFTGKVLLFFLPAAFLSWWLIVAILSQGKQLDILVLDLSKTSDSQSTSAGDNSPLTVRSYGSGGTNDDGFIKLPEEFRFGGPDKNALIVFNDLLGSAKRVDGSEVPCVFIPASDEEHLTHALYGVADEGTDQYENQWKPFDEFVKDLVEQLAGSSGAKKKAILVFDVDHPDHAGRLPPQVNPFIGLCKRLWDEELRDELANEFGEKLEVHIWLSHDHGQRSYFDSNPDQVESIFKHRFEFGLSGDIFNWVSRKYGGRHDVGYHDLKEYVENYVAKDSRLHNLVQTPVCLEPESFDDFTLLRYLNDREAGLGAIFNYRQRKDGNQLNGLWQRFAEVKQQYNWELENPLAIQQANVLLLQMERLWYEGKIDSLRFTTFEDKLNHLLKARLTIEPVIHSLRDAETAELRKSPVNRQITLPSLDEKWLLPVEVPSNATEEEQETAKKIVEAREKEIKKWGDSHADWKSALKLWQILLEAPEQEGKYQLMIGQVLSLLTKSSQRSPAQSSLAQIEFNEIAYLRRIHEELIWQEKETDKPLFEKLVRLSLKNRDESNRFVSDLPPMLVREFKEEFEKLESKRRRLEDQLFAHEGIGGSEKFENLLNEYQDLSERKGLFGNRFREAQASLVNSSHELRHQIEKLASGTGERKPNWIENFEESVNSLAQYEFGSFNEDGSFFIFPPSANSLQKLAQPTNSADRLKVASLNVFEDNLTGRRLLFWPALDLSMREDIREGLATHKIEKDNALLDSGELAPKSGLLQAELNKLGSMVESNPDKDIVLIAGKETELLRVARMSNRLPLYDKMNSGLQQSLSNFVNQFRSKKSDIEFHRIASDLWGSRIGSASSQGAQSFVKVALARHLDEVTDKLDTLCKSNSDQRLQILREETADVWEKTVEKNWQNRMTEIHGFSDGFGYWRWDDSKGDLSKQGCYSNRMFEPFETEFDRSTEFDRNMGMVLSIQSRLDDGFLVGNSEVKTSNKLATFEVPEEIARFGKNVDIYLRGHRYQVEDQRQEPVAPQDVVTAFEYDKGIKGTRLEIDRAPDSEIKNPILGEVSILLDCSNSMKGDRLKKVKDYVKSFLESAAKRKDIEVSLYAFGASYRTDGLGNFTSDPSNLSRYKQINNKDDVWRYPRDKAELLDSASVDGFLSAVGDLQAYGETPIAAALDLAVQAKGIQPQLTVLLTDGCEYTKAPGSRDYRPFDSGSTRLNNVRQKLKSLSSTLVIFNMFSADDEKSFATYGKGFDYKSRIRLINGLSEHTRSGSGNKLALLEGFLRGVLPKPKVSRDPGFAKAQFVEQNENGIGMRQVIQLGPNDRPDKPWTLTLKFEPPEKSIRAFKKTPVDWKTNCKNFGNEVLRFKYDPHGEKFFLETGWGRTREDDKEFTLASGQKLGVRNESKSDKPIISLASLDGRQLTPAPALAWLELGGTGNSILVQDFTLDRQEASRSNVHRILFPEIQTILENRTLVKQGARLGMKFFWLERIRRDAWTLVDVSEIDDEDAVIRIGGTSSSVPERKFVKIDDSLTGSEFSEYDFSISRENLSSDQFSIKLSIESPSGKPLDRWLVQLLDRKGNEPHRTCRRLTNRTYGLRESVGGSNKLLKITHEFIVDSRSFEEGAILGIANLDEIGKAYESLPSAEFTESYRAIE